MLVCWTLFSASQAFQKWLKQSESKVKVRHCIAGGVHYGSALSLTNKHGGASTQLALAWVLNTSICPGVSGASSHQVMWNCEILPKLGFSHSTFSHTSLFFLVLPFLTCITSTTNLHRVGRGVKLSGWLVGGRHSREIATCGGARDIEPCRHQLLAVVHTRHTHALTSDHTRHLYPH